MDRFTFRHLQRWIEHQFGDDQFELLVAMQTTYATDPEFYDQAGWWRCHDDMIAAGLSTL